MERQSGQDSLDVPVFGRVFLLCHPLEGVIGVANGRGGGQVVAQVIEVDQVAGLSAELNLHLFGDPGGAIADAMNMRVARQTRSLSQAFHGVPRGAGIAQRDRKRRLDFIGPPNQRQSRLFPAQGALLAPILRGPSSFTRLHDRNHAAVCFGNQGQRRNPPAGLWGDVFRPQGMGMPFGQRGRRAQRKVDTVMFRDLLRNPPEGVVGAKVRDDPLQGAGVAPAANLGAPGEGAIQFAVLSPKIGLLDNVNLTEGAMPVQFFLPVG